MKTKKEQGENSEFREFVLTTVDPWISRSKVMSSSFYLSGAK